MKHLLHVFGREALYNEFQSISKADWNHTFVKSNVFNKSWAKRRIKTSKKGFFDDQITEQKEEWNRDTAIGLGEIVTLKLYTDFDGLQFELKKCFRFKTVSDILKNDQKKEEEENKYQKTKNDLEKRLQHFYHWRGGLLIVLNKFGKNWSSMNNMVLYHGVNAKMLIRSSQTFAFNGPLSTSSSYHVARTFATAKGMVLKVTSHFPRLNFCNAFDASLISDYPEEQEWLVGFMYLRLLEVRTRKLIDEDIHSFEELLQNIPLSSWVKEEFFAIHLFGEQIYSMSDHLERIIAQFLKVNRHECCCQNKIRQKEFKRQHDKNKDWDPCHLVHRLCRIDIESKKDKSKHRKGTEYDKKDKCSLPDSASEKKKKDWKKKMKVMELLWSKFNDFRLKPNKRQRIKFDRISNHLRRFFMTESKEEKIETGKKRWNVSFEEISTVYPKAKELHFINEYKFNEEVLDSLIEHIENGNQFRKQIGYAEDECKNTIEKVVFLYYNYKKADHDGKPADLRIFADPDELNAVQKLKNHGWVMKHNQIGQSGYKIRIFKKKSK